MKLAINQDRLSSEIEELAVFSDADPPAVVVDLVYRSDGAETPVAGWARGGGAHVVDGIEVLVRQGALSFELWTGRPAPLEAMRAAARSDRA